MDVPSWDTQLNVESGIMLGIVSPQQVTSALSSEVSISQVKEDNKEYFSQRSRKRRGKERKRERE